MAVVTVEEALQLWEKALDTQVYKVEMSILLTVL